MVPAISATGAPLAVKSWWTSFTRSLQDQAWTNRLQGLMGRANTDDGRGFQEEVNTWLNDYFELIRYVR